MTENAPILRGRTTPAAPAPSNREHLDVQLAKATAIARAGDMLPKGYRGQPGAVVLAMDWADRHDVSIMDAIHGVAWVQGRPVIDASLQRALAQNAGYRVVVEDVSPESASVAVSASTGELIGRATYSMEEARVAGLAGKDNWKKNPSDMMVARASTRAIKWFCPGVLIGGAVSPEDVEQADAVAVLATDTSQPQASQPEDDASESPAVLEAEVLEVDATAPEDPISPATKGAVRAALDTAKSAGTFLALVDTMQAEGLTPVIGKLSEAQGQRVLTLASEAVAK